MASMRTRYGRPNKSDSRRPSAMGNRSIRPLRSTSSFNWHIEFEREHMRYSKCPMLLLSVFCLVIPLVAQDAQAPAANSQPTAPPATDATVADQIIDKIIAKENDLVRV